MKNTIFLRICAVLLAICTVVCSVTAVQIIRVYAEEGGDYEEYEESSLLSNDNDYNYDDDDKGNDPDPYVEPDPVEPEPEPEPESEPYQPDPFDYKLDCYTPSISFGQVEKGSIVNAKQFSIVNVGSTTFPLTWEEIDQYTAFDIGCISPDMTMDPGEQVTFSISPYTDLQPGTYVATYTFFSANDYRRHHTTRVDVSVTVKDNTPYVTSVDITPGSVTIPAGKSYQFDVTVAGGNGFNPAVTWSTTGNSSSSTTINSSGKLSVSPTESSGSFVVVATSKQDPSKLDRAVVTVTSVDYVVSVKADPSNGGAVAGGGSVRSGDSCRLSASPNNNFVFTGWYENGNLLSTSGQFTVNNITCDRNIVAKFQRQTCYVKTGVNNGDGGTITKSASVPYGGKMTITAKAKDGYTFAGFVENKKTISNSSSLELNNITSDRNITAVFNRAKCNVNVSVYPQDTGKYEGAGNYNKGSKVELKAQAYDGYEFQGWSINGQIVSKDTKYVIDGIKNDVNIVANFMKKNATTYKMVSGIATAGGSIVPSGDYVVAQGSSVTYNIVPQADYKITSVIVDGKNIGAVQSYTFNNIKGGHTITASFEKKPSQTPAKDNATSKKNTGSATSAVPAAQKKSDNQTKTKYNKNTAADGALPEQKVVNETIPEEVTELEGEEYEDDSIIPATDIEDEGTPTTGGIMARHEIDEETLRILIDDDAVLPMLREAFEEGTLQITVNNSYAADKQETAVETYYSKPTLVNFEDVIAETLTKEEKMAVLTGTPISFNIDITENTDTVDEATKKVMQTKVGYKPVSYFDFLIMKTSGGTTSVINNTAAELEVVVPIPEQFKKEGRKFFVIRNHNGVVDILEDIGSDPDTITFKTDRFSEYAIAYEAINVNKLVLRVVIAAFVSLILAIICFANLVRYKRIERRARRKNMV